eukprot:scaffold21964_cov118-Isochrysis_galbana.AAC.5
MAAPVVVGSASSHGRRMSPGPPLLGRARQARVDLGAGEVARPAHSSSLEEEEDGPRATTRLPAGRMRAALESR